jgi:hypothetical protein
MQITRNSVSSKPAPDAPRQDAIATARRLAESDDQYPGIVAVLNQQHRVIRCRDGLQWILQRRHGPERLAGTRWDSRSYSRTREALIRCSREHAGEIAGDALVILLRLPERIGAETGP